MVKVTTPIPWNDVDEKVKELVASRSAAKKVRDFELADQLRNDIQSLGYLINDVAGGNTEVMKLGDSGVIAKKRFLLLFGSGEIAPTSVDIYRSTFLQLGKRDLTISLITTPAGFQPNVSSVYGEIKDFMLAALPDFNLNIQLVSVNTRVDADNEDYITQIQTSDILFLGPGSPTYGIKHLKGSGVLRKIIDQVKSSATLILASAATITFSAHSLPVYEIYKVGEDLHWIDGLNLYKDIWKEVTIIPHFNNREGGEGLDTSHCYVGADRAGRLISMLPKDAPIIGIDEHTALVVDLETGDTQVKGKGQLHQVQ